MHVFSMCVFGVFLPVCMHVHSGVWTTTVHSPGCCPCITFCRPAGRASGGREREYLHGGPFLLCLCPSHCRTLSFPPTLGLLSTPFLFAGCAVPHALCFTPGPLWTFLSLGVAWCLPWFFCSLRCVAPGLFLALLPPGPTDLYFTLLPLRRLHLDSGLAHGFPPTSVHIPFGTTAAPPGFGGWVFRSVSW